MAQPLNNIIYDILEILNIFSHIDWKNHDHDIHKTIV